MLTIPDSVLQLAERHRIDASVLPPIAFVERCLEAMAAEHRNIQEIQKSAALYYYAQSRSIPNEILVRDEKLGVADEQSSGDPNSCLDSAFPFFEG